MVHKSISQFSNQLVRLRPVIDVRIFCAKPSPPRTTALYKAGPRLLPTKQATTRAFLLCTMFSTQWRRSRVAGLAHKDKISKWWWSWQRITQNSEAQPLLSWTGVPWSACDQCSANQCIQMERFWKQFSNPHEHFCCQPLKSASWLLLSQGVCSVSWYMHTPQIHKTYNMTSNHQGEKPQCLSRHQECINLLNPALLWHTSALVSPLIRKSTVKPVHERRLKPLPPPYAKNQTPRGRSDLDPG